MSLAESIKKYRLERGLTVEEVGQAISASHSTVTNWERGRKIPNGIFLVDLARVLGTTAEVLVYGSKEENKN
ncbi:MAG: helix-turn-helix transcriptional regulator [Ruminococcus sp.]|nr:helix-turn-helix transcriptional regulator [Ruminococcus sp.]